MSTTTPITSFWVCHVVTPALKSFKQSVWGAMTPWMTSVAGAEKTATNNSAGAVKSYESSLFAEVHDLGDDFATAADDFVDHVLGDWLPYAQSVASAVAGAAHGGAGALDTLLTSLRTAGATQAQDDRTSWKSYKLGIVGNEDGLMSAYAADLKAQGVVAAVNNYDNIAATPLADFQFQIGQQTTAMPMGMGVMRPTSDDDYINWGYGIAGAVNPPAPTPPTVDAQQLIQQIEKAAKPQNTVMMPIGGSGVTLPLRPDDPVNLIWPAGLPRPTVNWQSTVLANPTAVAQMQAAAPQAPSLGISLTPFYGNYQNMIYHWNSGSPIWATVDAAMMVSDVFLVKSLVTAAGKGLGKLAGKAITSPPNLSGITAGLGEGAEAIGKAANALNNAGDAAHAAEARRFWFTAKKTLRRLGVRRLRCIFRESVR